MSRRAAIRADAGGDPSTAIQLYMEAIQDDPLDDLSAVNLACLLWGLEDLGDPDSKRVSPEVLITCESSPLELLSALIRRRPDSTLAAFWLHYIQAITDASDVDAVQCRRWLAAPSSVLDPAMGLISATSGAEGHYEGLMLLAVCLRDRTARSRYVIGVISGVMRNRALAEHRVPRR